MKKISIYISIISVLFVSWPFFIAYAAIPTIEREALIAFYNSTDGDNWRFNTGWNSALGTECTWYGVTCSGDHVTRLYLSYNQLTGNIPAELGNLTNLQELYLDGNQLSGSIPADLGNLIYLEFLSLESNQLTGSIPVELMNMNSLYYINICGNKLYTSDLDLRNFLNSLQPEWESCQTKAIFKAMPWIPLLLLDN